MLEIMIKESQLQLSHHRLCHWNLKLDNNMSLPSATMFKAASSMGLRPHNCKCGPRVKHELDWIPQDMTQNPFAKPAQKKDKLTAKVIELVLQDFLGWSSFKSRLPHLSSGPHPACASNQLSADSRNTPPDSQGSQPSGKTTQNSQKQNQDQSGTRLENHQQKELQEAFSTQYSQSSGEKERNQDQGGI